MPSTVSSAALGSTKGRRQWRFGAGAWRERLDPAQRERLGSFRLLRSLSAQAPHGPRCAVKSARHPDLGASGVMGDSWREEAAGAWDLPGSVA